MNTRYFHNNKTGQISQQENVWGDSPYKSNPDWREIYKEEFVELWKMSQFGNEGITNQIFDTLMENVGMSDFHIGFSPLLVIDQECDAEKGKITFWMIGGKVFQIEVKEIEDPYKGEENG